MISTEGKAHIKRFLAGWAPSIAQSMVFGIGSAAESAADRSLQLEVARSPLAITTYDFVNDNLVFKAPIPEDFVGKIYEVGLFSLAENPTAGEYGSRTITSFDSATEDWVNPSTEVESTFGATSTRVGANSLLHAPAASATLSSVLRNVILDFSGNSGADAFTFALNVANANTQQVSIQFRTDASNYYAFTITTPVQTAGYKIIELAKSTATVTGTPNWSSINEVFVSTTSKASGASSVEFDAIRIEDKDAASLDYILVARKVLAVPFTKVDGMAQDAEFTLDVTL